MPLLIQRHDNFQELKAAWEALEPKAACTLFTSWQWQQGWWQTWGDALQLQLYSFRTSDGTVVGIAPLFTRRYRIKRVIAMRQLQSIGNLYPGDETVLSEYLDLIIDPDFTDAVYNAFLSLLDSLAWDELALPMITASSHYYRLLAPTNANSRTRFTIDETNEGSGIHVNTNTQFATYIAALGKNTRLKVFNRRTLLSQLGTVALDFANTNEEVIEFLDELNRVASARWGRPPFGPRSMRFHQQLAQDAAAKGLLRLSRLSVNGATVSLLYDFRFGNTEYNIQAAYDENFHAKISPGTLHLGYAIEGACENAETAKFDMLFGSGKNAFYKRHFNGEITEFFTLTAARSAKARLLRLARKLYHRLKKQDTATTQTEEAAAQDGASND